MDKKICYFCGGEVFPSRKSAGEIQYDLILVGEIFYHYHKSCLPQDIFKPDLDELSDQDCY